ncbi:MAG: carbohydrate-binding domain-containing protein, partial [Oscillospiraceae bacterium]|nr:carbohydrate-binding domain-containing protein [Oscillospiraceae bacterium]
MKKRLFALLLALALVLSLAPAAVFAEEASGETDDPTGEVQEAQEEDELEACEETEEDPAQEADDAPASEEAVTASLETEETEAVVLGSAVLTTGEGVSYVDENGKTQTYTGTYTSVASDTTTWNSGWYVVDSSVTFSSRITVSGTVYLILRDGCTLTAQLGIEVNEGNTLVIYGQSGGSGTVKATTERGYAAIGGGEDYSAGTIIINGGTISATAYDALGTVLYTAVGIGAGQYGANCGTIIINGGTVTAQGHVDCAGIGGGDDTSSGTITINGGTVTATSDYNSAGIGSGGCQDSSIAVTITGGTVKASGGSDAEAIGNGARSTGSTVTVSGGHLSVEVEESWCASGYSPYEEASDSDWATAGVPYTVKKGSVADGTVTARDAVYDGTEQETHVAVTDGNGNDLDQRTDYTVTYANNTNAGTATVTVTGTGDYYGTLQTTFTIQPAEPTIVLSDVSKTYDGQDVSAPEVTVTLVGTDTYNGDPAIAYYDESGDVLDDPPADVGSYQVVVTVSDAGSNYKTVSETAIFTISAADTTAEITGFNVPYDGQPHDVTVTAEDGATVTVTYRDGLGEAVKTPVEAGTYTAHVVVTKTGYNPVEEDVSVTITQADQSVTYETDSITKAEGDDPFTNPLTQTTVFGDIT